ncbi:LysR family transcriptional regulator [Amycolatopsis sp., V23-08]|uniref:LysR family transcriptional regulator n=1 Tax=Amycolatopsis heterodermiae TaxID=3110235 RepID=A0ABU5R4A6_9PSEU|nr:LysR family transcriptional regulator [Amycolatopsis sp., V23-08]MEA5361043.1 LysR family transcriptional regulator [Amycolatopsis sp., V23-08]
MDLRQLAVVVAVAEEGGFTAAAQRLHTVQSTVSTVVRALERDLGTPLFHRTTHRVALTPAGEAFVPAARAALEAVERARAAISPVHGRVRLGLAPGLLLDLHRVLAAVRDAHPGLVVEVRQLDRESLGCAVAESTVDIGLSVGLRGSSKSVDGLVTTPLTCEELVLATAPGGSRSAPGDLSGLSLVDFPAGWAIREVVDRAFADRRVSLEADDLTAAVSLVRAGLAACVLPASAAGRFPEVTVRRFAAPPLWQLAAVHRADPPAAVTAVLAHLG